MSTLSVHPIRPSLPRPVSEAIPLNCHWTRLNGHTDGHATSSAVWICEYPYPTMLSAPPDDCEGCPIWDKLHRAKTSDHS